MPWVYISFFFFFRRFYAFGSLCGREGVQLVAYNQQQIPRLQPDRREISLGLVYRPPQEATVRRSVVACPDLWYLLYGAYVSSPDIKFDIVYGGSSFKI